MAYTKSDARKHLLELHEALNFLYANWDNRNMPDVVALRRRLGTVFGGKDWTLFSTLSEVEFTAEAVATALFMLDSIGTNRMRGDVSPLTAIPLE